MSVGGVIALCLFVAFATIGLIFSCPFYLQWKFDQEERRMESERIRRKLMSGCDTPDWRR